ncbi:hypothetical protein BDV95DRAFT_607370 [Massariosphaeria phaeospora]|uniref:Ankyrin repeat-containing domain protein n=1 Tax=Massariosphaeria phaeospora TaxID=100035 RepID=A0A7C8I555_9PLEO|nr:hypothetical protein BDV95DRAFT_607370 [Massariosphaeria phaeospora]
MDAVSVFSVISASASLAKTCVSVVKALHDLAETYKHAELAIFSISEDCEMVQLAWGHIETWAKTQAPLPTSTFVLDRLLRSVQSGQLIMSALEEDIATAQQMKPGIFRRRMNVIWNEKVFQDHQNRIRGQVAALTLLLEVIKLPQSDDRTDMLSVDRKVFEDADSSVMSIVPSRSSAIDGDDSSISTKTSIRSNALHWIPFSFDRDLFTSYVYKRNYRPPVSKLPTVRNSMQSLAIVPSAEDEGNLAPGLTTLRPRPVSHLRLESLSSAQIYYDRQGIPRTGDVGTGSQMDTALVRSVQRRDYNVAYVHLKYGADLAAIFADDAEIDLSDKVDVLGYLMQTDPALLHVVLLRMAYTAGKGWIKSLKFCVPVRRSWHISVSNFIKIWSSAERAGAFADTARSVEPIVDDIRSSSLTVLQLVCAHGNKAVLEYLIRVGHRPFSLSDPMGEPLSLCIMGHASNSTMEALMTLELSKSTYEDALRSFIVSMHSNLTHWSQTARLAHGWQPNWRFDLPIAEGLTQEEMEDVRMIDDVRMRDGRTLPFLHMAIYGIHKAGPPQERKKELLEWLIQDYRIQSYDMLGQYRLHVFFRITPLFLAALLGEHEMLMILLNKGFRHIVKDSPQLIWEQKGSLPLKNRRRVFAVLHEHYDMLKWNTVSLQWYNQLDAQLLVQ